MKKLLLWISILLLSSSMVQADYMPTTQEQALMIFIEIKIDELSLTQAVRISNMVEWVIDRFDEGSKKHWFAQSIISHMADGILAIPEIVVWPAIQNGNTVRVDYVWSLVDGSIFDTSLEDVARESWLYNPARPYIPLKFTVWAGQMIAGFDSGVVGMSLWETKTLIIPPEEAYGTSGSHFLAGENLMFEVTIMEIE